MKKLIFFLILLINLTSYLYAQENKINFEKLLDSSDYKEKYRKDMIRYEEILIINVSPLLIFRWGEEKRKQNSSYFCQMAIENLKVKVYKDHENFFLIWIVTDARYDKIFFIFKLKIQKMMFCLDVIQT